VAGFVRRYLKGDIVSARDSPDLITERLIRVDSGIYAAVVAAVNGESPKHPAT
jgi:hypothetical protein